jgi:hypothetical protein
VSRMSFSSSSSIRTATRVDVPNRWVCAKNNLSVLGSVRWKNAQSRTRTRTICDTPIETPYGPNQR